MLDVRRQASKTRLESFEARLADAAEIAEGKACVYATGSFGRGEASSHSDLDLFIVGECESDSSGRPALRNLDAICLKAELIRATREEGLPSFDGDGKWLEQYTVKQLIEHLGHADDDAANTFTARLLLLLESKSIIGDTMYKECIDQVVSKYWRDYTDRKDSFIPAFLANDILRLWRTFCINYEARTETDPPEKKAKRKLKNYKLKHSRLLTCYSALAYMLAHTGANETFHPQDVKAMVALSPTERLESLAGDGRFSNARSSISSVLGKYASFLEVTDRPTDALVNEFMDSEMAKTRYGEAVELGDAMLEVLTALKGKTPFYRLLVV